MPIPSEDMARALAAVTLSASAKVVLVTLAILAGLDGVYLSAQGWSRLASSTGMSAKKVQRALRELEAAGWSLRVQAGRQPSTVRLLTWTKTVQASAVRSLDGSVHMDKAVRTEPARVVANCPSEGQIRVGGEGGGVSPASDLPHDFEQPAAVEPSPPAYMAPEQTGQLFGEETAPQKPKRKPRVRGDCTPDQWTRVHAAFVKGREVSGIPGWGPRDVSSNRKLIAKVLAEFELADFDAVVAHSAEAIASGEDPKWHTLTFIARKFAERVELAAAGPSRKRGGRMAITLRPAERDPTPEELANNPQLIRALEGQQ